MQSSAISISPSLPHLKPLQNPSFQHRRLPPLNSFSVRPSLSSAITSVPRLTIVRSSSEEDSSFNPSRRSSRFDGLFSSPSLNFSGKRSSQDDFAVKATSSSLPESAESDEAPQTMSQTLEIGILFVLWIVINIYFNIYNKQVEFDF